jgi:tetratricopeptide (TPR) repeat protein
MSMKPLGRMFAIAVLACPLTLLLGQGQSHDYHALIQQGQEALKQNRLVEAAHAFQRAVDINPSSVNANEGLGVARYIRLAVGNVRPSAYSDMAERAEAHLSQAAQLSPSAPAPLLNLADLESLLAHHSADPDQRAEGYKKARHALKRAIALNPSDPRIYLHVASLEHDEFGPVLQQARAHFSKTAGPIPDAALRRSLQQQYSALIDDAIHHALQASQMNANLQRPLLLLSRLFRERALIRDTQDEYSADMHTAADWRHQFLAVGGHIDSTTGTNH